MSEDTHPEDQSAIPLVEIPPEGFQSRVPEPLLKGRSDSEVFIFTEVSKMGSFIEWAAPVLVQTNHQARRTNGRVLALEADSKAIKARQDEAEATLHAVRLVKKIVWNRWFLIGSLAFFAIGVPWLAAHSGWVVELLKALASG